MALPIDIFQGRFLAPTAWRSSRAARGKATPDRWIDQIGGVSSNCLKPCMRRIRQAGNGIHQSPGVGHVYVVKKLMGSCLLNDFAGIHNRCFMGPAGHYPEVMSN